MKKNSDTVQCSISECKMKAIQSIKIGFKEKRNLCKYHYELFINKEKKYKLIFIKASDFK